MKSLMLGIVSIALLAVLGGWCATAPSLPYLADLEAKAFLEGHEWRVTTLAFSPDSKLLASGGMSEKSIRLWDVASGKTVATLDHRGAEPLLFSPDGKFLASSGWHIKLWDVAKRKHLGTLRGEGKVRWMAFSPDGKKLVALEVEKPSRPREGKKRLTVWSVAKQAELRFQEMPYCPSRVSAYPSIKTPLLIDTYNISSRSTNWPFKLIDAITGETILSCDGHRNEERSVTSWSMDREERMVASESRFGIVRLWSLATGENTAVFQVSGGGGILSPDAQMLAVYASPRLAARSEAGIRLYEVPSGTLLATLKGVGEDAFAFSPDGRVFAATVEKNIRLWTIPAAWRKKEK